MTVRASGSAGAGGRGSEASGPGGPDGARDGSNSGCAGPDGPGGGGGPGRRGGPDALAQAPARRSRFSLVLAGALGLLFFVVFVALGTWQLKRRVWKLDLIARIEQRVNAPVVAAPRVAEWPHVTAATHEYLHVYANGTFVDQSQTLVQALTDLGSGYWVMTPLQLADGSVVLVNRGFVSADDRGRVARAGGGAPSALAPPGASAAAPPVEPAIAHVTGLLRITEPHGAFLRHNDPATDHWYSRDVQAIATARGLTAPVAPYFIDAAAAGTSLGTPPGTLSDASPGDPTKPLPGASAADTPVGAATGASAVGEGVFPVGGLTVITFHNSHLVYAITWYTLALMVAGAIWLGVRSETRT